MEGIKHEAFQEQRGSNYGASCCCKAPLLRLLMDFSVFCRLILLLKSKPVCIMLFYSPNCCRFHSLLHYLKCDLNCKVSRKEGKGAISLSSSISLAVRLALLCCPSSFNYPTRSLNEVKPQVHSNNSVARVCAM